MRRQLVKYDFAPDPLLNFLIFEKNFILFLTVHEHLTKKRKNTRLFSYDFGPPQPPYYRAWVVQCTFMYYTCTYRKKKERAEGIYQIH